MLYFSKIKNVKNSIPHVINKKPVDFEIYLFMNEENLKKKVKIKLFK